MQPLIHLDWKRWTQTLMSEILKGESQWTLTYLYHLKQHFCWVGMLHTGGISDVPVECDFLGQRLPRMPSNHRLLHHPLAVLLHVCHLKVLIIEMPNYSVAQFIMTLAMFSVVTDHLLPLHQEKLSVWNLPCVLTFVIFLTFLFLPIPL